MNPSPNRGLSLQAYDGTDVPNSIDPDPTPGQVALARQGCGMLLYAVKQLGPATGRYNCHGLVFASRRTNIPPVGMAKVVDIDDLLQRDDCAPVSGPPQVGDIAVYRSSRGTVEHTGYVCRLETMGTASIVFVWSMWGGLGEFEHRVDQSPYHDCSIEYWRLRP